LTSLVLRGNDIGEQEAKHIADTLRENKILTYLKLSYNYIIKEGAKYIADAIKEKTLNTLNLASSYMGYEGVNSLKENKTLTFLNLNYNEIKKINRIK
jgi:Ran GTPase-activating protein (RanGAP) involved in mRNA processing and transport